MNIGLNDILNIVRPPNRKCSTPPQIDSFRRSVNNFRIADLGWLFQIFGPNWLTPDGFGKWHTNERNTLILENLYSRKNMFSKKGFKINVVFWVCFVLYIVILSASMRFIIIVCIYEYIKHVLLTLFGNVEQLVI